MEKTLILIFLLSLTTVIWADNYGAAGALSQKDFTLEEMLVYAIEDEYLALREYEAIINKFDVERPYSNIAESEKTHISYLEELYADYNLERPEIDALNHILIPGSLREAAAIGIQAEIKNIAMYVKFLEQDLPNDVRQIFETLLKGSENHLRAFQRQSETSDGRGRNRNN